MGVVNAKVVAKGVEGIGFAIPFTNFCQAFGLRVDARLAVLI